ncbi:MAG: hypothetical protein GFH27_549279n414 [Chloroflexi bacterium AL-W]|nr:hypothetical protein [Chloroflexi bacterium AL-N1]NOK65380.1 hypothetical protein [Chloroflexi bacterium AL-N10]NOK72354.1 hypothetical protein [Chloroflexi bacterium AL-N5]NOK79559.1 hypothetical protein [Chloroflexi bacterium AL-W]NOK87475.1 hypothetical protein [Chloroflexi bacterium AL-N15]
MKTITSSLSSNPEVLIIGSGPTGLSLALDLHQRGVNYRLLEKLDHPLVFSKANTQMTRTLEMFDRLGVAEAIMEIGNELPKAAIFKDGKLISNFKVEMETTTMPFLINIAQNQLEDILRAKLKAMGGAVDYNWELTDLEQTENHVTAHFLLPNGQKQTLQTQYLIGTDGAHSQVRQLLALPLEGITYPDSLVVTDLYVNLDLVFDTSYMWIHDQTFLLGTPYRERNYWHFVFNLTPTQAETWGPHPTLDQVQDIVRERIGKPELQLYDPTWISRFRIHKRKVSKYRVGRVLVIGDAAHLHSPMGGKGLGNSAQEAFNLSWKLASVLRGIADPKLLDTIEEERLPILHSVMQESEISHLMFVGKQPIFRLIRNYMLPLLLKIKPIARTVTNQNAQITDHYRTSSLTSQHTDSPNIARSKVWKQGPQAGDRAPDICLEHPDGTPIMLFEVLKHVGWILLVFSNDVKPNQIHQLRHSVAVYGSHVKMVEIGTHGELRDPQGLAAQLYTASISKMYLVRPDGYIGFRSQSVQSTPLLRYLERIFLPKVTSLPTSQFIPVKEVQP